MTHFQDEHPVARKPHWCEMCGRRIDPGEKYRRGSGMDGSTAWTWRECAHCAALAAYVALDDPWDDDGYGPDLFTEWEPLTVEHLRLKALATRRRWRHTDGRLYPVPTVEWTDDRMDHVSLHMGVAA